jgi:predicted peptidase
MTPEKPKRSTFDKIINGICIAILIYAVIDEFSHFYRTLDSIKENTQLYERHYSVSSVFPFIGRYFLMTPENYDPQKRYPLVVALHGVSTRTYAAESLAQPIFRKAYPVFVMVPIAPKRAFWATPQDKAYRMVNYLPYPDHLPQVMAGIKDISARYAIDKTRIYIVGHSMGASGVFGALERYPDFFAAGVASSGAWSPDEVSHINDPLLVFHGSSDPNISVQYSMNFMTIYQEKNIPITVNIMKGEGHGIGRMVYDQKQVWDWLLSTRAEIE